MKYRRLLVGALILIIFYLNAGIAGSQNKAANQDLFIRGDVFRSFCDHIYDDRSFQFNPKRVRPRETVFVKTDHDLLEGVHKPPIRLNINLDMPK